LAAEIDSRRSITRHFISYWIRKRWKQTTDHSKAHLGLVSGVSSPCWPQQDNTGTALPTTIHSPHQDAPLWLSYTQTLWCQAVDQGLFEVAASV